VYPLRTSVITWPACFVIAEHKVLKQSIARVPLSRIASPPRFMEFTLSEIFRSLCSLKMTEGEGLSALADRNDTKGTAKAWLKL